MNAPPRSPVCLLVSRRGPFRTKWRRFIPSTSSNMLPQFQPRRRTQSIKKEGEHTFYYASAHIRPQNPPLLTQKPRFWRFLEERTDLWDKISEFLEEKIPFLLENGCRPLYQQWWYMTHTSSSVVRKSLSDVRCPKRSTAVFRSFLSSFER